jgi:hypothetical protein
LEEEEEPCRREGEGGESTGGGSAHCERWRQRLRDDNEIREGEGATIVTLYGSIPVGEGCQYWVETNAF